MAKLLYNIENKLFSLISSDKDYSLYKNNKDILNLLNYPRRCHFYEFIKNKEQINKLLGMFNYDNNNKITIDYIDYIILSENINPYIIYINNIYVLYFGDDMPVVKNKTVKTLTKHYQKWTKKQYKEDKPETYYYINVKNDNKLFFFSSCYYNFTNGERLIEFNETAPIYGERQCNYIARLDYTDEIFSKRQKEIHEERQRFLEDKKRKYDEIERLKHTDGYCDYCGASAHYTVNPYYKDMYGSEIMQWLCDDCYQSCLGDI